MELGSDWSNPGFAGGICSFLATDPEVGPRTTEDPCVYARSRLFCYILFPVVFLRIEILLLPHTSKSSLSPASLEFWESWWHFWFMGGYAEMDKDFFFFNLFGITQEQAIIILIFTAVSESY